MARVGTAGFKHPDEHQSCIKHSAFWAEGIDREAYTHPYHPWKLTKIPPPTYAGLGTTSNDFYTKTWILHNNSRSEETTMPWAGKSAFHSPRFHGTLRCQMKRPNMAEIMNWATEPPPRTPVAPDTPLSVRSSARSRTPIPSSRQFTARSILASHRSNSVPSISIRAY